MGLAIQKQDILRILHMGAGGGLPTLDDQADAIMARIKELDGCYGSAGPDEPIFVLKSTDEYSPFVVSQWANIVEHELPLTSRRRKSVPEARDTVARMVIWKNAHPDVLKP